MSTITIILIVLVAVLYAKWIIIVLSLPFMCANNRRRVSKNPIWKVLAIPAWALERLMRGGWERYVLFQIGTLPSLHIRKTIYKMLGAHVEDRVVFHFKTEIRAPHLLFVGGVRL